MKKSDANNEPIVRLSTAIIKQAIEDYQNCFFDQYNLKSDQARNEARKNFETAKMFFLEDRQNKYTIFKDMNGKQILQNLDSKILKKVYESLDNIRAYCLSKSDCQLCELYNKDTGVCEGSMPYFKS